MLDNIVRGGIGGTSHASDYYINDGANQLSSKPAAFKLTKKQASTGSGSQFSDLSQSDLAAIPPALLPSKEAMSQHDLFAKLVPRMTHQAQHEMSSKELSMLWKTIFACGLVGYRDAKFLEFASNLLHRNLRHTSVDDLARAIRGLGALQWLDEVLLDAVASNLRRRNLSPDHVSTIAVAFGQLRVANTDLFQHLLQQLVDQIDGMGGLNGWDPAHITMVLGTMSDMRMTNKAFHKNIQALCEALGRHMNTLDSLTLSKLMWALRQLGSPARWPLVDATTQNLVQYSAGYGLKELAILSWSLSANRLGHTKIW